MNLYLRAETLAVARCAPDDPMPAWATAGSLWTVARSGDELSIVCEDALAPPDHPRVERGWRVFQLAGPIPFGLTGILASVLAPLAEVRIPIFAFSTFDTDYVLVPAARLDEARAALTAAGHVIL